MVFGVSEISWSCETQSTVGPSDLGRHVEKIRVFRQKGTLKENEGGVFKTPEGQSREVYFGHQSEKDTHR